MADTTLPPVSLETKKHTVPIPTAVRLEINMMELDKSKWTKNKLNNHILKLTDEIGDLKDQLKLFKELVYSYLKQEQGDNVPNLGAFSTML